MSLDINFVSNGFAYEKEHIPFRRLVLNVHLLKPGKSHPSSNYILKQTAKITMEIHDATRRERICQAFHSFTMLYNKLGRDYEITNDKL